MADIITYPENGITYDADDASGYLSTRLSGVYSADEDFAVTANGDLTAKFRAVSTLDILRFSFDQKSSSFGKSIASKSSGKLRYINALELHSLERTGS